jgi:hypothetical protein
MKERYLKEGKTNERRHEIERVKERSRGKKKKKGEKPFV